MRSSLSRAALAAMASVLAATTACDNPTDIEAAEGALKRPASAALGEAEFLTECASCHASRDGFDLAHFSFPDSTIVRRALGHVDSAAAFDIAAYIATLPGDRVERHARTFQPGGVTLSSDVQFAVALFGRDAWPADLTGEELAAIDPLHVRVAVPFPRWSFEQTNLDWMPDTPLPDAFLAYNNGAVGRALDAYYRTGSDHALLQIVGALRSIDRAESFAPAPCIVENVPRFRPVECFEVRRWTSSLVAQHMLRTGRSEPIHHVLHDVWWDVGNAARKSVQHGMPIQNAEENWAVWMYMGWAFSPERHASTYLATGLSRMGLTRHGTFSALRAQVVRAPRRGDPYKDLHTATRFAPEHWLMDAARFGYEHLIARLESGDVPDPTPFRNLREGMPESQLAIAWEGLTQARLTLGRRLGWARAAELEPLHARVEALLPRM